jgi:hypothetical protein
MASRQTKIDSLPVEQHERKGWAQLRFGSWYHILRGLKMVRVSGGYNLGPEIIGWQMNWSQSGSPLIIHEQVSNYMNPKGRREIVAISRIKKWRGNEHKRKYTRNGGVGWGPRLRKQRISGSTNLGRVWWTILQSKAVRYIPTAGEGGWILNPA